jgi:hypothetical protein
VESLAGLYHISPENLALRRQFIGLDDDVLALLDKLRPWPTRSSTRSPRS